MSSRCVSFRYQFKYHIFQRKVCVCVCVCVCVTEKVGGERQTDRDSWEVKGQHLGVSFLHHFKAGSPLLLPLLGCVPQARWPKVSCGFSSLCLLWL